MVQKFAVEEILSPVFEYSYSGIQPMEYTLTLQSLRLLDRLLLKFLTTVSSLFVYFT